MVDLEPTLEIRQKWLNIICESDWETEGCFENLNSLCKFQKAEGIPLECIHLDEDEQTPLHWSWKCPTKFIEVLLQHFRGEVNIRSKSLKTALHLACENGNIQNVEVLTSYGAQIDEIDVSFKSALHYACEGGHEDIATHLIVKGANVDTKDRNGVGAFHLACKLGSLNLIKLLQRRIRNFDTIDKNGLSPLHYACREGHIDVVRYLIAAGAALSENGAGKSPLFFACQYGFPEIVKLLMGHEKGAIERFKDSLTPLMVAIQNCHLTTVETLLSYGAGINIPDKLGDTPLHWAAMSADVQIADLLLDKGANINAQNLAGNTPLHKAYLVEFDPIVNLLIDRRANTDIANAEGRVPAKMTVESYTHRIERSNNNPEADTDHEDKIFRLMQMQRGGGNASKIFKDCIDGNVCTFRESTVMLIGATGMGKSTIKLGLMQKLTDTGEPGSTNCLLVEEEVIRINEDGTEWKTEVLSASHHVVEKLVEVVRKGSVHKKHTASTTKNTQEVYQPSSRVAETYFLLQDLGAKASKAAQTLASNPSVLFSYPKQQRNENKMKKILQETLRSDKEISDSPGFLVHIVDFGGQTAFAPTHTLFLSRRALYLLVFDISKDLHDLVEEINLDEDHTFQIPLGDALTYWVNTVATHAMSVQFGYPKIAFVATHLDSIPEELQNEIIKRRFRDIKQKFKTHPAYHNLIIDKTMVLNAKSPQCYCNLRRKIVEEVQKSPKFVREVPAKWSMLLEHALAKEKTKNRVISMKRIKELCTQRDFHLSDSEVYMLLSNLNAEKRIIYFNEGMLSEYVVLDIHWLIDALKSLITAPMFLGKDAVTDNALTKLSYTGVITEGEIVRVWNQTPSKDLKQHSDFLLELMERLDLIVTSREYDGMGNTKKGKERKFIIPAMLRRSIDRKCLKFIDLKSSPAKIFFRSRFLSQAVFHRFIVNLLKCYRLATHETTSLIFTTLCVLKVDHDHYLAVELLDEGIKATISHQAGSKFLSSIVTYGIRLLLIDLLNIIFRGYDVSSDYNMDVLGSYFSAEVCILCVPGEECFVDEISLIREHSAACPKHGISSEADKAKQFWLRKYTQEPPDSECEQDCKGTFESVDASDLERKPSDRFINDISTGIDKNELVFLGLELGLCFSDVKKIITCKEDKESAEDIHIQQVRKLLTFWRENSRKITNLKPTVNALVDAFAEIGRSVDYIFDNIKK